MQNFQLIMWKTTHLRNYYFLTYAILYIYSNDHLIIRLLILFISVYLAAHKTKCRYMIQNGSQCIGNPVLKCLKRKDSTKTPSYFIGCSEWRLNEMYHRFININEN